MANYYDILGVGKSSSEKEIKQAFRNLARKYHPDVNPDDRQAEDKFKKINEAYEVLSNPDSKKKYDMYDKYIIYFIKIFIICFNYINIFRKDINEKWR